MKPFDTTGEYSPEEVKAALAGTNGIRQLSFRYERLNSNNSFIEDIDYVSKCTMENNSLADIKRTAKFNILDTGTINYLQDRIKAYIRLHMPEGGSYSDYVKTLKSDVWWKMDDPDQELIYATVRNPANGLTYNTFASAYNVLEGDVVYANIVGSNDATNRNVFWAKIDITENNPVDIYAYMPTSTYFNGVFTAVAKRTVYVQTGDTEDTLEEIPETPSSHQPAWYDIEQVFPELKTYYFKFEALDPALASTQVRLEWWRPRRVSDTSGNELHGMAMGTYFEFPGIVQDGGYSISNANNVQTQKKEFVTGPAFAGSVWLADTTSAQLEIVFSSSFDTDDNTAGPEDSDCEAWIDYTAGEVSLYAAFNGYDFTRNLIKSFDPTFLRKVRHFAWSVNVLEDRWFFWLDGVKHELDLVEHATQYMYGTNDMIPAASRANRVRIDPTQSGAAPRFDDFIWFNNSELDDSVVKKIYRLGTVAGQTRKGYVEWPQGVFVLSSPTRTMQDGNTITREVEGYDQLVNLKEDSFDYRYSVKAGAKYTEAIFQVLQSSKPKAAYPLTDSFWSTTGSAQITSESSVLLYTVDAAPAGIYTGLDLTLKDISVSAKMDGPSTPSTTNTQMQIEYLTPQNTLKTIWIGKMGANIKFVDENADSYTTAWNAVNDAYWRLRESGGYMYFETSANNVAWTERRKLKLTTDTYVPSRVTIIADHDQALVGSAASEIKVTGYGLVDANITRSTTTLPTGMEWEPGTTKLSIINDLLGAINYESATYDENGTFIGRPYVSPQQRTPGFRYATDDESVIRGDVDQSLDIFSIPNKWVVVVSDPDRPMLVGEYTNDDPHSPTSTVSRGRTIVDYRTEQSAPDQLTLDAQAARLAFEASQVYESIEFDTAVMPIHQNNDVYELVIDGLVINNKYSEVSWSMELKNGATMSHKVRRVVAV